MQALMAARISGAHCNFCRLGSCASLKRVVVAIARQQTTVNPANVDLFTVSLRRWCFASADEDDRAFDPARCVG
jgi:hypothetical protein